MKTRDTQTLFERDRDAEIDRLAGETRRRAELQSAAAGDDPETQRVRGQHAEADARAQLREQSTGPVDVQKILERAGFEDITRNPPPPVILTRPAGLLPISIELTVALPNAHDPKNPTAKEIAEFRAAVSAAFAEQVGSRGAEMVVAHRSQIRR